MPRALRVRSAGLPYSAVDPGILFVERAGPDLQQQKADDDPYREPGLDYLCAGFKASPRSIPTLETDQPLQRRRATTTASPVTARSCGLERVRQLRSALRSACLRGSRRCWA
jgi:hypothetical protein